MANKTRLGQGGYAVRRRGSFAGKAVDGRPDTLASKTRLGSGGHALKRLTGFADKTPDEGVVIDPGVTPGTGSTALKKPGIPSDTDAWLKTMLEIMLGRRGNAVPIPQGQTLTFSTVPTKEECEALYGYLNTVRTALDLLITRFDS